MSSGAVVRFGVPEGAYAERPSPHLGKIDELFVNMVRRTLRHLRSGKRDWGRLVRRTGGMQTRMRNLKDEDIPVLCARLRGRLRRDGFREEPVAEAFALIREVARRTVGMEHFDVQLIGGWVLLQGMVAEMDTGEGKTLTATLPVSTLALAGVPVHLITSNDYLAERDAELMGPIYQALGFTVGVVVHGMDADARRAAYACDITYCTNKEVAFDYLKDRILLGGRPNRIQLQVERLYGEGARLPRLLLRGLYAAIVDEADSVLVDEARTPLIISGGEVRDEPEEVFEAYYGLADRLERGRDYQLDERNRRFRLTQGGYSRLEEAAVEMGGAWRGNKRSEEMIIQALNAKYLFLCDEHYLVKDNKVHIIDEYSGRLASDRHWEQGLQQFVEVKEGVPITGRQETRARISYQRFFRRYLRLSGMTGTGKEVAGEMWSVYGLHVVPVPTNRPRQRAAFNEKVFSTADLKRDGIEKRIRTCHEMGRPVLVGTRSVATSEHLSKLLEEEGLQHQVLNARQDGEEAEVVAQAGGDGRITVATNMAGRGTDIKISPEVEALGGLHVIATERHDAGRIDRQLFGRCGRQGNNGSYELFVSLEDEVITKYANFFWRWVARRTKGFNRSGMDVVGSLVARRSQLAAERQHSRIRYDLLRMDEQLESHLAFSGHLE